MDNKDYTEVIKWFHALWDAYPGMARLITKDHLILAANERAEKKGFREGTICARLKTASNHRACKMNRTLTTGEGQKDRIKEMPDNIRGWLPVAGYPELVVHFSIMVPEIE